MKLEEAAKATQAMQEYIERHLKEPLTLRRIADAAGYSPWYAERLFREAAGMSPFEYVRARRLTRAALVLRDEQPKVIDVALDFLFDPMRALPGRFPSTSACRRVPTAAERRPFPSSCPKRPTTVTGPIIFKEETA